MDGSSGDEWCWWRGCVAVAAVVVADGGGGDLWRIMCGDSADECGRQGLAPPQGRKKLGNW